MHAYPVEVPSDSFVACAFNLLAAGLQGPDETESWQSAVPVLYELGTKDKETFVVDKGQGVYTHCGKIYNFDLPDEFGTNTSYKHKKVNRTTETEGRTNLVQQELVVKNPEGEAVGRVSDGRTVWVDNETGSYAMSSHVRLDTKNYPPEALKDQMESFDRLRQQAKQQIHTPCGGPCCGRQ